MAWLWLIAAILFEVCGTTAMKFADGFRHLLPSIVVFACYGASIACLTVAVRSIEISVAYALWAALGMTLITVIGIVWFGEAASALKLASITVIILGVMGLRLAERLGG
ncbi:MAG: multidrug efflux SMR transporter [Gammaproteobacteria bacterium]|nr:multidrug efflux SMR transporter [Gammaproteobacteria bacterium]